MFKYIHNVIFKVSKTQSRITEGTENQENLTNSQGKKQSTNCQSWDVLVLNFSDKKYKTAL